MLEIVSKQALLKRLAEEGLPHTYLSLVRWEKQGIIEKPRNMIQYTKSQWRVYTIEEVEKIVGQVKKFKGIDS